MFQFLKRKKSSIVAITPKKKPAIPKKEEQLVWTRSRLDGWVTPQGGFWPEKFNHKETLETHGVMLETDTAIRRGYIRLSDEGSVLHAEAWFLYWNAAVKWFKKNVPERKVELILLNNSIPKIFWLGPS